MQLLTKLRLILVLCILYHKERLVDGVSPKQYDHGVDLPTKRPLNIAHRGSCGDLPEHTVEAYMKAVEEGADVIECDVCVTKDLKLICMHESWLSKTTDAYRKFPSSKISTHYIPYYQQNITDYYSVDFTLEEIKTLRVHQRYPFRNPEYDGQFSIPTLEEYVRVAQSAGRPVGIYPETKDPEWVNSLDIIKQANTTFEKLITDELSRLGYTSKRDPCFLQTFSFPGLLRLKNLTELPLVMLLDYEEVTTEELQMWASVAYAIGPWKEMFVKTTDKRMMEVTDMVSRAHQFGLKVHAYTFRNEDQYLAWNYSQDPIEEYKFFFDLQVDGYFTDFPKTLGRFLDNTYAEEESCPASVANAEQKFNLGVLTSAVVLGITATYVKYLSFV